MPGRHLTIALVLAAALLTPARGSAQPTEAHAHAMLERAATACGIWGHAVEGTNSMEAVLCFGTFEDLVVNGSEPGPERTSPDFTLVFYEFVSCSEGEPCLAALGLTQVPSDTVTIDPTASVAQIDASDGHCDFQATITGIVPAAAQQFASTFSEARGGPTIAGGEASAGIIKTGIAAGGAQICSAGFGAGEASSGAIVLMPGVWAGATLTP